MNKWTAAAALALFACRGDPGEIDYTSHVGVIDEFGPQPEVPFLEGPDPFQPGDLRGFLGLGYEGVFTEEFVLGSGRDFFIFVIDGTSRLTFTQTTTTTRIEGTSAEAFILNGSPFWGGGFVYETPADFSTYDAIVVSLRSADPAFERVTVEVQSEAGSTILNASDYGYVNDGEFHTLRIPLVDFADVDFSAVTAPFILAGSASAVGDTLVVDNLYYEGSASN